MLIGMMLIPTGDAASKLLSNTHGYHPFFITWARFTVGSFLVLPFMPRRCFTVFRNPVAWGRGLLLAMGISVITFAVALEDLADVFAVFFIGPIISYILAAIFLKEANFAHCQTRLWLFHWTGLCPFRRLQLWRISDPVASGRGPRRAQSSFVLAIAHRRRPLHAYGADILAGAALRQPIHARRLWRCLHARQYVFDPRLWARTCHPHGTLRLFSTGGRIIIGMGCFWYAARHLGACRFGLADDLRLWLRILAPLTPAPTVANSRRARRILRHIHETPGGRRAMAQKPRIACGKPGGGEAPRRRCALRRQPLPRSSQNANGHKLEYILPITPLMDLRQIITLCPAGFPHR